MDRHDADSWLEACQDELLSLRETCTYTMVGINEVESRNVIGCHWVFAIKTDADGSIEHYKARIIAKGFSQIYQVNYDETFTPVVKWDSICILLMLTAQYDLKVHQMDVKTVFLNGDLDHAIYMECLQEVPITDPKELCGNSRRVSMVSNKHPGPGTRRQKTNSVILVSPAVMWTIVSLFTMVGAKSFAL